MKRSYLLWVLVLAVGLVMPAVAGEYEKCKADTKVNVKKDGSLSNATWNVSCKPQDGEITISEVRAARIQQLLGKNVIKNNGVAIKGKCKSDDCRVED